MPHSRIFCIAKSCYNYQPSPCSPAFFNLPSDLESRLKWIGNAGRLDLKDKNSSILSGKYYICADHFESHCFVDPVKKVGLKRGVDIVPTIFKNNLVSLVNMDGDKTFRDSQSTLAGTVLAEVESAQEILDSAVVSDDVLDTAEWTNIVAVSLGDDGNLMCDSLNSPSQTLSENTVCFATEETPESNETVMECLMLCRLCAALVQLSMLVPVFGDDSDINLRNMLNRIVPGQVLMDDGLPQRVCTSCVERVQSCFQIIDSFKAADTRLRQMVELCNFGETTIVRDGTITLQGESGLPIILQTVTENPQEELEDIGNSISTDYSGEEASFRLSMKEVPISNLQSTEHISIDAVNFNIHVEEESLDFNETQQIKCGVCQHVFNEQAELVSHCVNYHSIKLEDGSVFVPDDVTSAYQCSICDDVFTSASCLKNHMFSHVLGTFECSLCKLTFNDKNDLDTHLSDEHSDTLVFKENCDDSKSCKCELCGKEFRNGIALRKHKATHTGERTVLCSLCGKTLANLNSLRVHMRTHSDDRPFTCSECGKSFKGPSELRSHSITHSREKVHSCPECGRKFHSKGLVRQHMLSHTNDKPYKCDMCTASFNRLGNLNQHKKKHIDKPAAPVVTPYECSACGKRFQSKLTLKYHSAKHTGDKYPFDCEICGKKFIALDPYRVHMRVHTGERPFECEMCKKSFRSSGTLKQHIASLHRDDFPFACSYCQRSFKRLQSLIVHKKTHTGEKPWLCSQCGRAFAQKGDMIKHTKTHRTQVEEEEIIMEGDTMDDLALDNEISKMIFG